MGERGVRCRSWEDGFSGHIGNEQGPYVIIKTTSKESKAFEDAMSIHMLFWP